MSRAFGDSVDNRSTAASAVRLAQMYQKIGNAGESVKLIDETLNVWRKGTSSGSIHHLGRRREGREEVGSGFTKNGLKRLGEMGCFISLLIEFLCLTTQRPD